MLTYKNCFKTVESLEDAKAVENFYAKEHQYFPSEIAKKLYVQDENPIKVFREYRKITQKELAQKLNVSKSFICQLEHNTTKLSLDKAKKIAKILNVGIELIV